MHLLGRYSNSLSGVKKIHDLLEKAASERVERNYVFSRRAASRLNMSQNILIVKLYRDGWKPIDIAREVGTTEWTVHHRLNRNDVERRPVGMSEADCREAVRLYRDGESMRRISLKLGFNDKTIKKALVEAEVEIRESPRHPRK